MKKRGAWKYIIVVFSLAIFTNIGWSQTPCSGGMAGGYPCNNIDMLSYLPLSSIGGGTSANDVWGWVDPLTGKEYVLQGKNNGTAFIDITDPVNPIYLGSLPTQSSNSSWRDIKVLNDHAFIVSEAASHGIQSFDLTTLRNVISPPVTFSPLSTYHNIGAGRGHNIVGLTESGHMIVVGGRGTGGASGGLILVDVTDPSKMVRTGDYSLDGYTHDAQAITYLGPDTDHIGKEIVFASNEDTQTIIDVSDKSSPVQLSRTTYGGSAYTHQGWVTQDHRYLIFNDELDERNLGAKTTTIVFDITDLDSPVLAGSFVNTTDAIDHNLYVRGNYIYQSNYRSGLRILKMDDPSSASFSEVGFFDVYPTDDNAQFSGTWSNYPFFPSGNIAVSNMDGGVFIVKPNNLPHFEISGPSEPEYIHQGETAEFALAIEKLYGFTGNVTLTHSGAPAGATVNITNSILSVSNTGSVPAGNYSILIQGVSGDIKHDISLGLIVTPPCNLNVSSNASSGPNTLANSIGCFNPGEKITLSSSISNMTIDLGSIIQSLRKDVLIEANPTDNIIVTSMGSGPTFTINQGVEATLKGFKIRTNSNAYETLKNSGKLILQDMIIENTQGNEQLVSTIFGKLEISGTTTFKN